MTASIARRPSAMVEVRAFTWHPDPDTMTALSTAPALPPHLIYADALCSCGRQLLDSTDETASGHDGRRVWTYRGAVYGSARCAAADFDAGPDDREVPGTRPQPFSVRVPLVLPYGADPAVLLGELAETTRQLLALGDGAGSFFESERIKGDAQRILAAIGGAA